MIQYLIVGGFVALGGLLIWMVARTSEAKGAAKADAQHKQDALDEVRKANEAVASVGDMSSDVRRKRLQQWSRD